MVPTSQEEAWQEHGALALSTQQDLGENFQEGLYIGSCHLYASRVLSASRTYPTPCHVSRALESCSTENDGGSGPAWLLISLCRFTIDRMSLLLWIRPPILRRQAAT